MNNQEYEQKKGECWKECAAQVAVETENLLCKAISYTTFDRAYALGKQEIKQEKDAEETVISGWVARDEDGHLFMYSTKPERDEALQVWMGRHANFDLRDYLFPDLTWDSDPEEVEIIIKRKKNG